MGTIGIFSKKSEALIFYVRKDYLAVAGLLTVPPAAPETCGQRFRRGQETRAEQCL